MVDMNTWDVLIPTIPHRHEELCALLAEFDRQQQPGFGVRVYRDNLERPMEVSYRKWQDLVESSDADYVSYAGDDDWIAPNFVACIMAALQTGPDYIGFPVKFTDQGTEQPLVMHSLRYAGWNDENMTRDIVHQNPMRREFSLLGTWRGIFPDEDVRWAAEVRATGKVQDEIWISEPMYHYRRRKENFWAFRTPMDPADIPPLPSYPWLTAL